MQKIHQKLRVSHYPQIPCKPFSVEVKDEEMAFVLANALANQHLFLFENGMISDYSNSIIVEMWDDADGEGNFVWCDYFNENEQMEWEEFADTYLSVSV